MERPISRGPAKVRGLSAVSATVNLSVISTVPPIPVPQLPPSRVERVIPPAADPMRTHRKRLFAMNMLMSLFHFGLVIVTCVVGNLYLSAPLYSTKLTFTLNNGTSGFALVPSSVYLSGFPLTVLTAVFFALSGTFHFGNATFWREHYMDWLDDKKSPMRWLEYYLSASVMILLIGYTTGLRSFVEMLYAFFLIATTMTFGWLSDETNRPRSEDEWENPSVRSRLLPHVLGYPPMIAVWVGLLFTLSQASNECGPPSYVYALVVGELILFVGFGLPQLYQIMSPPKKYIYGEYVYQIMSLVAKGTLGGILLAFVLVYDTFDDATANSSNMTNCNAQ